MSIEILVLKKKKETDNSSLSQSIISIMPSCYYVFVNTSNFVQYRLIWSVKNDFCS